MVEMGVARLEFLSDSNEISKAIRKTINNLNKFRVNNFYDAAPTECENRKASIFVS